MEYSLGGKWKETKEDRRAKRKRREEKGKEGLVWADAFYKSKCPYGRKSVNRIATKSMS